MCWKKQAFWVACGFKYPNESKAGTLGIGIHSHHQSSGFITALIGWLGSSRADDEAQKQQLIGRSLVHMDQGVGLPRGWPLQLLQEYHIPVPKLSGRKQRSLKSEAIVRGRNELSSGTENKTPASLIPKVSPERMLRMIKDMV